MQLILTPELVLEAYRQGLFPMSYSADSPYIHWICPDSRGQLSIPEIHLPKRLIQTLRAAPYDIRINTDFEGVIEGCAEATERRPDTWINSAIIETYTTLHRQGHAHCVECWDNGALVGGIYGLAIGGAFFGESMFSRARDASKVALAHLTARLWKGGFSVFDTQFVNEHLRQFGVYEISHKEYKQRLTASLQSDADLLLDGLCDQEIMGDYLEMRESNLP